MRNTQKLSNSFLVYSVVALSALFYIFGISAVLHFIKESSQLGFVEGFLDNAISASLGIISLFLIAPIYRFTKSLRILDISAYEDRASILTLYSPFFISDMPQAESKTTLENLKKVSQNSYFNSLVELHIQESSSQRSVRSFISSKALKRLKEQLN